MEDRSIAPANASRYNGVMEVDRAPASRLPTARPRSFAPTPPPGLGRPLWPPNEDGHICELTKIFRRCPHCSWSARMENPWSNTHNDRPAQLERRYVAPGLHPPHAWPACMPWKAPYRVREKQHHSEGFHPFDPRCMLWWSQWEIVHARVVLSMSDSDICSLFRYRWAEKESTMKFCSLTMSPKF